LVKKIVKAEAETKDFTKYVLNIALDYGGRDEIVRAMQRILRSDQVTKWQGGKAEEKDFNRFLDTGDQPYPDLLIRPSGEQRTSGMFCWQGVYAELYWLPKHFPDFSAGELRQALLDFSRRRRRFGGNDDLPKYTFDPQKVAHQETIHWRQTGELFTEPYVFIPAPADPPFDPTVIADLLAVCRQRYAEFVRSAQLDSLSLEQALLDFYGEVYRLSALQLTEIVRCRLSALRAYHLAQTAPATFWRLVENYLTQSYQALRYVAS
jgi:hypothetical protein